ncbi:MAG: hypothetical protein ABJJ03_04280, partial [Sulfitobacter sp.]
MDFRKKVVTFSMATVLLMSAANGVFAQSSPVGAIDCGAGNRNCNNTEIDAGVIDAFNAENVNQDTAITANGTADAAAIAAQATTDMNQDTAITA